MQIRKHLLLGSSPGTQREVTSLHFGGRTPGPKAYIQASLHADEIPPMLVAQHLRRLLLELEEQGQLIGEIVVVPAANPIGLGQRLLEQPVGRFEFGSGENFNRHYPSLVSWIGPRLMEVAHKEQGEAVDVIRNMLRGACDLLQPATELQSLRKILLGLAIDADTVLDLHCDNEALLHAYTTPRLWPMVKPLAALLDCPLALLAEGSGDDPFDESCSMTWQKIAERLGAYGASVALCDEVGSACVAATVELRGERDVSHESARTDADAVLKFLAGRGHLASVADRDSLSAREGSTTVHPLAGTMPVVAPASGVLVYLRELGQAVGEGEPLAEIVDPVTGHTCTVASPVDGLFFARDVRRYVAAGARIAKVSGSRPVRTGKLMSA